MKGRASRSTDQAPFLKHFSNLLVVSQFVIPDKRDRGGAVDRTEKRMFENDLAQTRAPVLGAQRLQASTRRIKVFDQLFLRWGIQRLYALWRFHPEQA